MTMDGRSMGVKSAQQARKTPVMWLDLCQIAQYSKPWKAEMPLAKCLPRVPVYPGREGYSGFLRIVPTDQSFSVTPDAMAGVRRMRPLVRPGTGS